MNERNLELEAKFDEWWEENYMNVSADRTEAFDIYSLGLKHQQAKVGELQKQLSEYIFVAETIDEMYVKEVQKSDDLQKRVEGLERKLQIKTRHCEFYEQSRKGHRSLAIHRKKQINSALEQIEKLYAKAESDYEKERNPYYDGMLSALDLAEQAIRGELEEQALKGGQMIKTELTISKNKLLVNNYKITPNEDGYDVIDACNELVDCFENLEEAVQYCLEHDQ
ncbi:hypothetical protein U2E19_18515 [Acinetobacter baumannii]|uniref:hypothetical protein n=1 Tax=Acinetobacter baumannii TaxID=470 RepID=UPI00338D6707